MNTLYFVRHGENPANVSHAFSSRLVDYGLTPRGVLQAQQTAAYFSALPIDALYASPMKRTAETAAIIGAALGLEAVLMEQFREVNVGAMELEPTPENWEYHHQVFMKWFAGQAEAGFDGGDNYHTLWGRMRDGLLRMLAGREGQRLILVGHGGILIATLPMFCPGVDVLQRASSFIGNGSITEMRIDVKDGEPVAELLSWGSVEHLSGDAAIQSRGIPDREEDKE